MMLKFTMAYRKKQIIKNCPDVGTQGGENRQELT